MSDKEELMKQMDEAALQARAELVKNLDAWSAKDLIVWWAGSYMKAGHKRLGRVLVELSKSDKIQGDKTEG